MSALFTRVFFTLAIVRGSLSSSDTAGSCVATQATGAAGCQRDTEERIPSKARSALQLAAAKMHGESDLPWQVALAEAATSKAVSSQPFVETRVPPEFSDLPPHVYQAGLKAYGSEDALMTAVRSSQIFDVNVGNFKLTVHCAPKDDISDKSGDLEDSYRSYGADRLASQPDGVTVWDIGANLGILTAAFYKTNPKLTFVAVEAMPETFFYLNWNLAQNGIPVLEGEQAEGPGVLPLNQAIGNGHQNVTMVYPKDPGGANVPGHEHSSIHVFSTYGVPNQDWVAEGSRQYQMPTISLGSLYMRYGLSQNSPVVLFFDCQGCEFDGILPSLEYLSGTQSMGGELHCYDESTTSACVSLQQLICKRGQQGFFRWFNKAPDGHEALHRGIDCQAASNVPR